MVENVSENRPTDPSRIRICYCLSYYYPIASGAERQAHRQAVELVRRGHGVQLLTRALPDCPAQEWIDGVRVYRQIRPIEFGPGFGLSFIASLARGLWQRRNSYDIVHCHQALWEAVACGLVSRRLGKPTLVQPAAGGEFGELNQLSRTRGRRLLRRLILKNTHFVAISHEIEQELNQMGVLSPTRLSSGVDTDQFCPGPPPELDHQLPPGPRVLFLGRLHAQKNLDTLLEAWPEVARRLEASLLFAGDGPEARRLRNRARAIGCAGSTHFLGAVQNPLDLLRAADVFVLPSVAEGMSNSLLEAMAVGLPVVASNAGGNVDLVSDGKTGLVVDARAASGWTSAIVRLLQDARLRRELGSAARRLITAHYSIRAVVDRYEALYRKLLAEPQAET